ncbi:MAG: B12-binding domain-containing radical SAM protein [Clostridiales bacterium]|nr:B12-binding domain-containing radical SAM protein [Clostridiales bacterium]
MHRYNGNFGTSLHYAPLTLTTLAALVPAEFADHMAIYDETVGKIPLDLEADLVCITCITGTSARCYRYADHYRARGMTVVLGGVHPTLMPFEAKEHADCVVTGFAEQTFPRLIYDFAENRMRPFYHQGDDYEIAGKPMPKRGLLQKKGYITHNTVEAVRGCPLPCTFCAYPAAFGKKIYTRPVREIIAEIAAFERREVLFPDVNLLADHDFAKKLFTEMIPLKKWWMGLVTSSITLDNEMLTLFRKSGCKGLLIGFESVMQESQASIRKGVNQVSGYTELMKKLHDHGILVMGCFAFGSDEEDASIFERTVEAVVKADIDLPRYAILTPFPNTEYYRQLEAENRIVERSWGMYDVEHCVYLPKKMTREQLEAGNDWAWRETYRYKNIFKRISLFRSLPFIALATNISYRKYADKLTRFTREVMLNNDDIGE